MITISCAILEQVRQAPAVHAQLIATNNHQPHGNYGMFAAWQDTVKRVHNGQLGENEAVKFLQGKFIRFDDNVRNRTRQNYLLDQLPLYLTAYNKRNFIFTEPRHQMKWDIVEGVRLTGLTPWVVTGGENYFAYFIIENQVDWRNQLRFPLIQQYLSDNHIDCDVTDLQVGTYCLATNRFDFKSYTESEITDQLTETGEIFQTVFNEYNKHKK
ncbi:MAG: hypothetical protein ABI581_14440 [Sediminibacterium sp.]